MSQMQKVMLIMICIHVLARFAERLLIRRYMQNVLWEMPWNKWQTFEEIRAATNVPRHYLRRIMLAFMQWQFVDFQLDDTRGLSKEEMQEKLMDAITPSKGAQFVEFFQYRRVVHPKKRKKKFALPDLDFGWSPAKA